MLTSVLVLVGIVFGLFIALCVLLYFEQDRMLFYPGPNDPALRAQWQSQRIEIGSGNRQQLEGWWTENPSSSTASVIVYFGGNAEDVLYTASTASRLNARGLLVVNYRGYGGTPGKPGQDALYEDALAIYDYVVASGRAKPEEIVVMGRSLGSGLAALLAAKRQVGGAILITPFDSISAVASTHYPFFPVGLLLKHRFEAAGFAAQTTAPALFLAAEQDRIIPPRHARRLFEVWSGAKTFHLLEGAGHNDIELHPEYYTLINAFLRLEVGGSRLDPEV